MSESGDPDYDVGSFPNDTTLPCGPRCLKCRDCRTGLLVNMAGALPIVGTYTLDDSSTFEILEIHWLFDTLESVFLGPVNDPAGHVGHTCCKRVIGCAVVEVDAVQLLSPISLELNTVDPTARGNNAIGIYFNQGDGSQSQIWFEWLRTATDANEDYKSFFCDLEPGVSVTLPNTQAASYQSGRRYITDADGETIDIEPAFCNQDGTHTQAGAAASANDDDEAECVCVLATMPYTHDITFRDLNNVCADFTMRTTATEFTYPLEVYPCWTYTHALNSPTLFGSEEDLATEGCPAPVGTVDTSITCDISFRWLLDGYDIINGSPFRFKVEMTFYDGAAVYDDIEGYGSMTYNCVDGLAEQTVSIDMYSGASLRGTIEVEVVHT